MKQLLIVVFAFLLSGCVSSTPTFNSTATFNKKAEEYSEMIIGEWRIHSGIVKSRIRIADIADIATMKSQLSALGISPNQINEEISEVYKGYLSIADIADITVMRNEMTARGLTVEQANRAIADVYKGRSVYYESKDGEIDITMIFDGFLIDGREGGELISRKKISVEEFEKQKKEMMEIQQLRRFAEKMKYKPYPQQTSYSIRSRADGVYLVIEDEFNVTALIKITFLNNGFLKLSNFSTKGMEDTISFLRSRNAMPYSKDTVLFLKKI